MCVWVIALHTYKLIAFASMNNGRGMDAPWATSLTWFMCQVDVFFVISSFLLSSQLLTKYGRTTTNDSLSNHGENLYMLVIEWIFIVIKKLFRMWPAAVASACLSFAYNDFGSLDLQQLFKKTLTFEMDECTSPISSVVTWSNRVDIISTAVVALVVIFLARSLTGENGRFLAGSLTVLSLAPVCITMVLHPECSVLKVLRVLSQGKEPESLVHCGPRVDWWLHSYPQAVSYDMPVVYNMNPVRKQYGDLYYLAFYNRWCPFFIGIFLAVAYFKTSHNSKTSTSSAMTTVSTSSNGERATNSWYHNMLLFFSCFCIALPTIGGILAERVKRNGGEASVSEFDATEPSSSEPGFAFVDYYVIIFIRPALSCAVAYLLYRVLLPKEHPLCFSGAASFLSARLFRRFSPLTYSIYVCHFIFLLECIFRLLPLQIVDDWMGVSPHGNGNQRGIMHVLIYTVLTLFMTTGMAVVIYRYVETPVRNLSISLLNRAKRSLLRKGEKFLFSTTQEDGNSNSNTSKRVHAD